MTDTSTFEGWVILELMGHRRLAGYLKEEQIGGATFIRIDVPAQSGTLATQFYSPSAVYCITPVSEELSRKVAVSSQPEPVTNWDLRPSLPSARAHEFDDVVDDADDQ